MLIGLIRHGITDWNAVGRIQGASDIPLNAEGREQAKQLANRLMNEEYRWDFVITSSLSRARETGEIIARLLDIPVLEPDSRIIERSFGKLEGITLEERVTRWGEDWELKDLGQESKEEVRARALAFMDDMARQFTDKNILVVSHGGLLAQLYLALYADKHKERIGNLSLTILKRVTTSWELELYNCTRHLLPKTSK